ncbi:MAG: family 43 glycosylhydrolase, partial [Bacteroidales bacterium]|nr:family 43 glycosylhydrolase [Bacteroidales bacterium]
MADPYIMVYNGYYYCTGTTGTNISIKKARTLEGIKTAATKRVFSKDDGGPCCDYWAPEIFRLNDKWYIYYTANDGGVQHTYVIENESEDPLTGQWVNKGRIFDSNADYWAIDGTIMTLHQKMYFIWSGVEKPEDGDKPQRLYIGLLENPWTLAPGRTLISSPQFSW